MARSSRSPSRFAWLLMEVLLWSPFVYRDILRQRTGAMRDSPAYGLRRTLQTKFREPRTPEVPGIALPRTPRVNRGRRSAYARSEIVLPAVGTEPASYQPDGPVSVKLP